MTHCLLSHFSSGVLLASGGIEVMIFFVIVFGPILVVAGGFVALMTYRKRQLAMQRSFISTLAVAADRTMPLAPTIRACADECGAWPRGEMMALADMIEAGVPLPEAFGRSAALFPAQAIPVIQAGLQTSSLGKALRQFIAHDDKDENLWASLMAKLLWLTALLMYGALILMFYMIKIAPSMQQMFEEFGMSLPHVTQFMFGVSNHVVLILPLVLLALMVLFFLSLFTLLRYSGWIAFNLPGVDCFLRRYDMATVLETLALAVDQRQKLEPVLATFASLFPKTGIRKRLNRVCSDMERGADWCKSLVRHKLIKPADEAVLQSAIRVGNLGWALRQLAGSHRRRFAYRAQTLAQVIFPPVVILAGIVVSVFVIGCFMPLVRLIQSLA